MSLGRPYLAARSSTVQPARYARSSLEMDVRHVASKGPQTLQFPCAAMNSSSDWLLILCGQNAPCVVTEMLEARVQVLRDAVCYKYGCVPCLHPFLKLGQLGAGSVRMRRGT